MVFPLKGMCRASPETTLLIIGSHTSVCVAQAGGIVVRPFSGAILTVLRPELDFLLILYIEYMRMCHQPANSSCAQVTQLPSMISPTTIHSRKVCADCTTLRVSLDEHVLLGLVSNEAHNPVEIHQHFAHVVKVNIIIPSLDVRQK